MPERTEYKVTLKRFDIEKAARKLIKTETDYCPDDETYLLEHTHFYGIKLESVEFDCDEGDFEWTYTFSDNGSLKRWGE